MFDNAMSKYQNIYKNCNYQNDVKWLIPLHLVPIIRSVRDKNGCNEFNTYINNNKARHFLFNIEAYIGNFEGISIVMDLEVDEN